MHAVPQMTPHPTARCRHCGQDISTHQCRPRIRDARNLPTDASLRVDAGQIPETSLFEFLTLLDAQPGPWAPSTAYAHPTAGNPGQLSLASAVKSCSWMPRIRSLVAQGLSDPRLVVALFFLSPHFCVLFTVSCSSSSSRPCRFVLLSCSPSFLTLFRPRQDPTFFTSCSSLLLPSWRWRLCLQPSPTSCVVTADLLRQRHSSSDTQFCTSPVAASKWQAGKRQTVAWRDNGKAPPLANITSVAVQLWTGSTTQQTMLSTLQATVPGAAQKTVVRSPGL